MGFGGERNEEVVGNQKKSNDISLRPLKLSHMETDTLREWAKQYGLVCVDSDREILLKELVRSYSNMLYI